MNRAKTLTAPISVNLEITESCNLKCFFCFCKTDAYKSSHVPIPSSEKAENIMRILDILAKDKVFEVRLLGGEFALLKEWKKIVSYAQSLRFFISFVSNGNCFSEKDIAFIVDNGISSCSISLHGLHDLHDQIVNTAGSFDKALRNIQLLTRAGVKVSVLFTPSKVNIAFLRILPE